MTGEGAKVQLLGWLAVCLLIVLFCRRNISLLASIGLIMYLAVPSVARGVFVGSGSPMHPATIFVVVAVFWVLLTKIQVLGATAVASIGRALLLLVLALHAILLTFIGTGSLGQLFNSLIGPMLLLGLVAASVTVGGREASLACAKVILVGALFQALLGLIQVVVGRPIFYESQYSKFYWFDSEEFSRALGTLDSALDLALLLVIAIPLTVFIQANVARIGAVALLLAGVFATQSRLGVVLALAGTLYVAMSGETLKARLVTALGVVTCGFGLLLSRFGQDFLERAGNATGSTMRRSEATDYIIDNVFNKFLIGGGFNSSFSLRSGGILGSSLENGFAMYAFDFGWLASAGILIVLSVISGRCLIKKVYHGAVSMLVMITMLAGYSSFMTQSASGAIMFFVAGVFAAAQSSRVGSHESDRNALFGSIHATAEIRV